MQLNRLLKNRELRRHLVPICDWIYLTIVVVELSSSFFSIISHDMSSILGLHSRSRSVASSALGVDEAPIPDPLVIRANQSDRSVVPRLRILSEKVFSRAGVAVLFS